MLSASEDDDDDKRRSVTGSRLVVRRDAGSRCVATAAIEPRAYPACFAGTLARTWSTQRDDGPAARRAGFEGFEGFEGLRSGSIRARWLAVNPAGEPLDGSALTLAISAAIVELYAEFYQHVRATATTYINDNVVVCVLENILTEAEDTLIAEGSQAEVIDGRVAFQAQTADEFTAAIERLTRRRVVAFLSSNQTAPGVACELFFLDGATPTRRI